HRHTDGIQYRRSPGPGRLALSLLRDQPGAEVRPRHGARHAPRHSGRHGGAVRAPPDPRGGFGRTRRPAHGGWFPPRREGKVMKQIGRRLSSGSKGRTTLRVALTVLAMGVVSDAMCADDAELRWRLFEQDDQLVLFIATSDETDNTGSPSFSCKRGSDTINVT